MHPVHVSQKHQLVVVPFAPEVQNLFPDAKSITIASHQHLALPHQPVETYMLRRMGFDVPAPVLMHYDWSGGAPFDVQRKTCALLTMEPRAYVLNGMGTGKTKAALWSWDYLRGKGLATKMLVLAPLSTLSFVWGREVFNTLPHRKAVVLHGDKKRRLARLNDPDADIFVINHDGYKTIEKEITAMVAAGTINTLVIDELAVYRNSTDRAKAVKKLAALMKIVWGLTGSPIPNGPTDAWGQASIVTPNTVPKFFGRFRDDLMFKVNQFKFLPKPDAVEQAYKAMQPAVRFTLEDVLELPECIERTIDIEMGPKQAKVYKALIDHCYAAVKTAEITAANAGAVLMKLLQVSSGWVYAKDGTVVQLDNDARVKALIDCIMSTDRKVLVFAPFKHALAGISKALDAEGIEHAVVSGDTPVSRRSEVFNLFQNSDKYRVIAAHPQCVAHGITLTAADTVVWFGPVTSLEIYDQANHRIIRIGQKFKQQILHLQSTPVEKKLYALLQGKQKVQNQLLSLFEEASR